MFKKKLWLTFVLLLSLGLTGCDDGDDGAPGPPGPAGTDGVIGADGADGAAGANGISCWDLDMDGVADPEEDTNGDGLIDVVDCRAVPTSIEGTISSASGALDHYVSLQLTPAAGGAAIEITVEADGDYAEDLAAGQYDVIASRPGYEDYALPGMTVEPGVSNSLNIDMIALAANTYIGSEDCGVCHAAKYASFIQTGHPYKLNKVENGVAPTYPFTSLEGVLERVTDEDGVTDNTLGTPLIWEDVSYVIGGYFWKARFIDADGYIVTGSEVQYNFATDALGGYHDNEVDKPYNCGNCHTTGWRHTDAVLNPTGQDGLAGMQGTFFDGGIQCEACHGAGSTHAQSMDENDITENAPPRTLSQLLSADAGYGVAQSCGDCHTRDGEKDYPAYESAFDAARTAAGMDTLPQGGRIAAKGGLIRHHEQYDEVLGIDPDTLSTVRSVEFMASHGDCNTCHNVHGSAVHDRDASYTGLQGIDRSNAACMVCHSSKDPTLRSGGMTTLNCIDCHMPKLAKSATSTAAVGTGPVIGDVTSHIFRINLDSTTVTQFTVDGSYAYPWITADWACRTCHNGDTLFDVAPGTSDTFVFHNN
jgi:hypothetical protein